jgi:hypothetical protein
MAHDLKHDKSSALLPAHVALAYDTLEVEVG